MAWSCSGTSNVELISNLLRNRLINAETVAAVRAHPHINRPECLSLTLTFLSRYALQAMTTVDRANYVLDKRHAYEDSPQYVTL
jgi:protein-L-isoaspartate(D-aspartate) O-methyltransferase